MHPPLALGLVVAQPAESGLGGFDAAAAENTVGASQHACFGPRYHGSYLFPRCSHTVVFVKLSTIMSQLFSF